MRMKRLLRILGIGVLLGLVLVFVQHLFDLSTDTLLHFYWMIAVGVVVAAFLFNALYHRHYQKKMQDAAKLLEQGKTEAYIATVSELRQNAKGRYLKNLFTVNLTTGYCDLKEYAKAIELLRSMESTRLYGTLKIVYAINLCVCWFYGGQPEQAMDLYERSQTLFQLPLARRLYGGNVAVLDLFALLEKGDAKQAKELLDAARLQWTDARLQSDFQYLEEKIGQQLNNDLS